MNATPPGQRPDDAPINPALQRQVDPTHGARFEGTDPMQSVSVKDPEEGSSWPMIWAIVGVVCVAIAIYYLVA